MKIKVFKKMGIKEFCKKENIDVLKNLSNHDIKKIEQILIWLYPEPKGISEEELKNWFDVNFEQIIALRNEDWWKERTYGGSRALKIYYDTYLSYVNFRGDSEDNIASLSGYGWLDMTIILNKKFPYGIEEEKLHQMMADKEKFNELYNLIHQA